MSHKSNAACLLGLVVALSSCSPGKKEEDKLRDIPVRTMIAGYDAQRGQQGYVGIAEEELSSSISFSTNGTIEKMYAAEGQHVAKGTLLAELNTANHQNAYAAAKATSDQAEDAMARIQLLYDNESVPEIKYMEMKANLEKAKAAEAMAKKNLTDTRLLAPFSGIIGQKRAEAGENVLPNQSVYLLLKIDRVALVNVSVPEKEISRIRLGQPATIRVAALDDEVFEGVVAEKGVWADPVSHTYTIRVRTDNGDGKLLPGMVCRVTTASAAEEQRIIAVPNQCVQKSGSGSPYVWRIVEGKPVRQPVQTGKLTGGGVEIRAGLEGGEEIIIEGYQHLFDGATIRIAQP